MTGPLVGVTVLRPVSGTVVLPGQFVTCSGRATGHGGLQTTFVDRVVLSLDRGSDIEANLSPVVPRPAVPAVNWAASVAAPDQPGPHDLTITAFPDDGGTPASITVGFVVQEPATPDPVLTPQQSLELSLVNPDPPGPGDWASAIVKANRSDLDFTAVLDDALFRDQGDRYPVCSREWVQVTVPSEDYDLETAGFSGWLLQAEISGADVPFTHPFGRDWKCLVVVDPPFAGLLAAGNVAFDPNDPNDDEIRQAAVAYDDLGLPAVLGMTIRDLGGLMAVETDERCVSAALHPPFGEVVQPGDRIAAIGRWIVDAAHTAAVEPRKTPQLPEGGTSFRSEVHPPLLMAIGGTRVLTPTDVRTRIVLTSRPFLARQVYVVDTDRIGDDGATDDGTLLQHLDHEIGNLSPDWWQLGFPGSVTIEAHPQIAAKPFDGVHVAALTVRPPPDTAHLAGPLSGEAQASYQFTHRAGVGVQVIGTDQVVDGQRQASVEVLISLNDAGYQSAPLPPRQEYMPSADELEDGAALVAVELATSLLKPGLDPVTRINRAQALWLSMVTDAYDVPGVNLLDRSQAQPFIEVTQIPAGAGIVENSAGNQPYPVFGWLDIRWHRPDVVLGGP
jgi:hypothetical protein